MSDEPFRFLSARQSNIPLSRVLTLPAIQSARRRAHVAAVREGPSATPILKRASWSEEEVLALPRGEHDFFDRKSAIDFQARQQQFFEIVAKALSAFANSGGGHLILGLQDDGTTFDGLPPMQGRTPTREWLEQKIPNLLSYELQDFRVHEVIRANPSTIPPGNVILVVDVGDSALAPHQTAVGQRNYYVRQGGHSVIAPHHYLELLRQRISGPTVTAVCEGINIGEVYRDPTDAIVIRFDLDFLLRNEGRVAAYKWELYPFDHIGSGELNNPDFRFGRDRMPLTRHGGRNLAEAPAGDETILPGRVRRETAYVALFVRPEREVRFLIQREAEKIIQTRINYRVATETYRGDNVSVTLGDHISADKVQADICGALGIR